MEIRGKWEGPFLKLPPWLGYGLFLKLHSVTSKAAEKKSNSLRQQLHLPFPSGENPL